MTVIAYRDGVLAADTAAFCGHNRQAGVTKAARRPDGVLAAGSGEAAFCGEFLRWALGQRPVQPIPARTENGPTSTGLLIYPDGRIELHEAEGMFEQRVPYFAEGAGAATALGAMFAGADAETAVRAAIAHNVWCGGEVMVLRHGSW